MKLPGNLGKLAKGEVKSMTPSLDPSKMSPEAIMATLWVNVQDLKADVAEIKDTNKWILRVAVGCLATAVGGLLTALLHLAGAYLTMIGQHAKP